MNALILKFMVIAQEKLNALPAPPSMPELPTPPPAPAGVPTMPPLPTPPPGTPHPTEIPVPSGGDLKQEAVGFVRKIISFFRDDFFPNLWMYLTILFMLVIAVLIFAAINIACRFVLDPIFFKIFRFREGSKVPPLIGGIISIGVAIFAFSWFYTTFPALRAPVELILRHFR